MATGKDDPEFDKDETPSAVIHPHPLVSGRTPSELPPLPADAPEWYLHARAEFGVHEVAGAKFSPRILEYFKATTLGTAHQSDETAWCSAFACWCMERAGLASPHRANARSWLNWGVPLKLPQFGCVAVLWRGTPQSAQGHVAFYVGERGGQVQLLGGNQNNAVSLAWYPRARVLMWRWPTKA